MQSIHHSQTRPQPDYYKGNGLAANTPARPHVDGMFRAPTDVAFDADDNIYISDGYINSRVAKFTKDGDFVASIGDPGRGPKLGELSTPHTIANDAKGNIYVGDRGIGSPRHCDLPDGDNTTPVNTPQPAIHVVLDWRTLRASARNGAR